MNNLMQRLKEESEATMVKLNHCLTSTQDIHSKAVVYKNKHLGVTYGIFIVVVTIAYLVYHAYFLT